MTMDNFKAVYKILAAFEKAMDLIKKCDGKLKEAEETINKIVDENKDIVEFNTE